MSVDPEVLDNKKKGEKMKKIKVPVLGLVNEKTVSGFAFCGASAGSSGGSGITYSSSRGSCSSGSTSGSGSSSSGIRYSSASCSVTGSASSGGSFQTPSNSSDVHCDINAYNMATQSGYNGGSWDGNKVTVNQIYDSSYAGKGNSNAVGDAGYGFVDFQSNGGYEHMFYYTNTGSGLKIYDSNGVNPLIEYNGDSLLNGYYKGATVKFVGLDKR